jgi:hypothetical protein
MRHTQATTTMRTAILAAVVGAVALAGCGGGNDAPSSSRQTTSTTNVLGATAPPCEGVFVDGRIITADEWAKGCTNSDGAEEIGVSYTYKCGTAWQNSLGWGYEGKPFHKGAQMPGLEVLSTCGGG